MTCEPHNTFDLVVQPDGLWLASSHNFPGCTGVAEDPAVAVDNMHRKIIYLRDNQPLVYRANLDARKRAGVKCLCGHKFEAGEGPGFIIN